MKMKKRGIFAVVSAALLVAALVVGCMSPLDDNSELSSKDSFDNLPPPPAGYKYLRVNIPEEAAKYVTIYPTAPSGTMTFNAYFDYQSGGSTTNDRNFPGLTTGNNTVFLEDTAVYNLTVEQYSDGVLFAVYTHGTAITGGTDTAVTTNTVGGWSEIADGEDDGTFEWNITAPTGFVFGTGTVTFTVNRIGGAANGTTVTTIPIANAADLNNISSGIPIESGYYDVNILFTQSGFSDRGDFSKMHIHQGMVSTYTPSATALPAMNKNSLYTVRFNVNTANYPGVSYAVASIADLNDLTVANHGDRLNASDEPLNWTTPLPVSYSAFAGWYNVAAGPGQLWVFNNTTGTQVGRSMNLYAHFTPSGESLGLTITQHQLPPTVTLDPSNASISAIVFEGSGDGSNAIRTIQIQDAANLLSTNGINAYTWRYNGGLPLTSGNGITIGTFGGVTTAQLAIDYMDNAVRYGPMGVVGVHVFSVEATDSDNKPWSAYFTITVTNPDDPNP